MESKISRVRKHVNLHCAANPRTVKYDNGTNSVTTTTPAPQEDPGVVSNVIEALLQLGGGGGDRAGGSGGGVPFIFWFGRIGALIALFVYLILLATAFDD